MRTLLIAIILFSNISCKMNPKLNLHDINADNYSEKLEIVKRKQILKEHGLHIFFPDRQFPSTSFKLANPELQYISFEFSADGTGGMDFYNAMNGYRYLIEYEKGIESRLVISSRYPGNPEPLQLIGRKIDELLKDYRFLYSTTKLKDGQDIIIKEISSSLFLIGRIVASSNGIDMIAFDFFYS